MDNATKYKDKVTATGDNDDREVRFGAFQLFPARGILLKNGEPQRIGSRAIAVLSALAERPGQIIPNEALMKAGWPDTNVEDANLRVQMGTLRRLLDDAPSGVSHICNAPGRGYSLTILAAQSTLSVAAPAAGPPLGLSLPLTSLVGREDAVSATLERIRQRRCVTVVGPGGMGKTRVAIAVAWSLMGDRSRRVCFVDLAPLSCSAFVETTIAAALQLADIPDLPARETLVQGLRSQSILLVLDNCEHVLDTVARLAHFLLGVVPGLKVLATSREPLLIDGETTVRLGGLALPDEDCTPATLADAMAYPAIELLVDRAASSSDSVSFMDADVSLLARICRRLDGIPLAIELAAARIEAFGVEGLARHIEDQFSILGEGRRSAAPRHRTLNATLEWSFEMLVEEEKRLFLALSIFRATFSMDAAVAVAPLAPQTVIRRLADLVTKSLVVVDRTGSAVRYRLLETTRRFAEGKMRGGADHAMVATRHAQYFREIFTTAGATDRLQSLHSIDYRQVVADVRSAIYWAMNAGDDPKLGARLIIDSAPMWLRLSIFKEYAAIIQRAAGRFQGHASVVSGDAIWLASSLHETDISAIDLSRTVFPMLEKALVLSGTCKDVA